MEKTIELTINIPECGATEQEIESYINFEFGYCGSISGSNPLVDEEIEVTDLYIRD